MLGEKVKDLECFKNAFKKVWNTFEVAKKEYASETKQKNVDLDGKTEILIPNGKPIKQQNCWWQKNLMKHPIQKF
jgi:hypothetical protein